MRCAFAALALLGLLYATTGSAFAQAEGEAAAPAQTPPAVPSDAASDTAPAEAPPPEPEPVTTATVHVIAENVESSKGTVWLALCNTALSVDGCPYKMSTPASAGFVEVTFEDIPPGDYAVVGFHDVNGNDKFDKLLGVPREPYALSAAAGDMLVPRLKDALVPIKLGTNDVIVHMKRLGE